MKNYEDFLDHIKSDPSDNIHEITAQLLQSEFEAIKSQGKIPDDMALVSALTAALKSYSTDLLRRYHEWLHE